jgi:hypothetical protein
MKNILFRLHKNIKQTIILKLVTCKIYIGEKMKQYFQEKEQMKIEVRKKYK